MCCPRHREVKFLSIAPRHREVLPACIGRGLLRTAHRSRPHRLKPARRHPVGPLKARRGVLRAKHETRRIGPASALPISEYDWLPQLCRSGRFLAARCRGDRAYIPPEDRGKDRCTSIGRHAGRRAGVQNHPPDEGMHEPTCAPAAPASTSRALEEGAPAQGARCQGASAVAAAALM